MIVEINILKNLSSIDFLIKFFCYLTDRYKQNPAQVEIDVAIGIIMNPIFVKETALSKYLKNNKYGNVKGILCYLTKNLRNFNNANGTPYPKLNADYHFNILREKIRIQIMRYNFIRS